MEEKTETVVDRISSVPADPDKNKGGLLSKIWEKINVGSNSTQNPTREPRTLEEANVVSKDWLDNP